MDALNFLDSLLELPNKLENTVLEPYIPIVKFCLFITPVVIVFKYFLPFLMKLTKKIYEYVSRNRFIKDKILYNLSFMESADVIYAINQFIPTRFSTKRDPGNDDEPAPIYLNDGQEKDPLLIEHFCKFEFDVKEGKKYSLCLADCGMGKTTFIINLYYQILRQGKYKCFIVSLQEPSCIDQIEKYSLDIKKYKKKRTILLLDALDENDQVQSNYNDFMDRLWKYTKDFYRVVITSRTNFFESESKEKLSSQYKISGITSKLSGTRKFYITPFTDDDIRHYLNFRYRHNRKKQKKAWELINRSKNLSVRPLLLRFMDELLTEDKVFEYDFQLYECIFDKWIDRERKSLNEEAGKELYDECIYMAKTIYYQWLKTGLVGIFYNEVPENNTDSRLKSIQLKGHAIINRTGDGLYKFSHKSYWEYMLAKLALSDIYFSCDLLIENFDRAVSFLDEMIQYYNENPEELTPEIIIGIANYKLKYKKPEDAEELYHHAIRLCDQQNELKLFAMIQLTKCYQRQLKNKSAADELERCKELMQKIPLRNDTLPLYVQFGSAFAADCKMRHTCDGQNFYRNIITFCTDNNLTGYPLLQCYEGFCYCSINYGLQQQALKQMKQLWEKEFQKDQYAEYFWDRAQAWNVDFMNSKFYDIVNKIVETGWRFMDSFEKITWYGNLAVSGVVIDKWDDITVKYLGDACDLAWLIYNDGERDDFENPYTIAVYQKMALAWNLLGPDKQESWRFSEKEYIDSIFDYMDLNDLNEEMSDIRFVLLDYIREDSLGTDQTIEYAMQQRLEIASNDDNIYNIVSANLSLYSLYSSYGDTWETGQQYLEQAYNTSQNSSDYKMTTSYCDLLHMILNFYEGEIDKSVVAQELMDIVPDIYGNNIKRLYIYSELKKYLVRRGDIREINVCFEMLRCEFDAYKLEALFRSCKRQGQQELFINKIKTILEEKGFFSNEEIQIIEKFLADNKNQMIYDVSQYVTGLLSRNQVY